MYCVMLDASRPETTTETVMFLYEILEYSIFSTNQLAREHCLRLKPRESDE